MKLIIRLAINVFALLVVEYLVPGFELTGYQAAIALPISLITFGISAFLINVFLLWGVAYIVPGFEINNFLTAIAAAIVLSLVSWFLHKLASE